jgi:succinate-acetate transporter protein
MTEKPVNPAPLGLMGFGVTTVLLNLSNAGLLQIDSLAIIVSMGIFYGGIAQIIAGILEAKQGNTFGTVAFTSYGLFWFSFVGLKMFPNMGLFEAPSSISIGAYLLLWGIFTFLMSIPTFKMNRALQVVFVSLTILFFVLALGDFTGVQWIKVLGGYEGIFCGSSAVYLAIAEVINSTFGRDVLPIGAIK